jgi:hypothetical protein
MDRTKTREKKFAGKKFSCPRPKCESIVTKFYALCVLEELKSDLKYASFVTTNHKHVKQLRVLIRYFQAYDLENPVKNKLLTFVAISGDAAYIKSE